MLLYAECGHTRAAIAQYDAYAALLRKELGAEPGENAKEIHRLLIEGHAPARRSRGVDCRHARRLRCVPWMIF